MSDSGSIQAFGGEGQSNRNLSGGVSITGRVDLTPTYSSSLPLFYQSLAASAVEKANRIHWTGENVPVPLVTYEALWTTATRTRPFARARRCIWWITYHHPLTKGMSFRDVAKHFGVDHRAIVHGTREVRRAFREERQGKEASYIREVCHDLNEVFPFFDPDRVNVK